MLQTLCVAQARPARKHNVSQCQSCGGKSTKSQAKAFHPTHRNLVQRPLTNDHHPKTSYQDASIRNRWVSIFSALADPALVVDDEVAPIKHMPLGHSTVVSVATTYQYISTHE